jgi:hypothetical protein
VRAVAEVAAARAGFELKSKIVAVRVLPHESHFFKTS